MRLNHIFYLAIFFLSLQDDCIFNVKILPLEAYGSCGKIITKYLQYFCGCYLKEDLQGASIQRSLYITSRMVLMSLSFYVPCTYITYLYRTSQMVLLATYNTSLVNLALFIKSLHVCYDFEQSVCNVPGFNSPVVYSTNDYAIYAHNVPMFTSLLLIYQNKGRFVLFLKNVCFNKKR